MQYVVLNGVEYTMPIGKKGEGSRKLMKKELRVGFR
jgi:hypothetical protein